MDPERASRLKDGGRRQRSQSLDSEEERRERRRKKEYDMANRDTGKKRDDERSDRYSDRKDSGRRSDHDGSKRDKYEDRDRDSRGSRKREDDGRDKRDDRDAKRRRSRSPDSSRRRRDDGDARPRSTTDRSPRGGGDKLRSSREGSATQVTRKSKGPLPSQAASFHKTDPDTALVVADEKEPIVKEQANFAPSGLLAAASNAVVQADGTTIALKYHEPPEARKPPAKDDWKLFVFKGADILETIDLGNRSCWLVGREVAVVDLPAEHPSISKQHAVLQWRNIEKKNEYGDKVGRVRPYLIDLESANGTSLNKKKVPTSRYLELRDKDMLQFGHSTREYVLMLSPKT